jgi:hypothetical protein
MNDYEQEREPSTRTLADRALPFRVILFYILDGGVLTILVITGAVNLDPTAPLQWPLTL